MKAGVHLTQVGQSGIYALVEGVKPQWAQQKREGGRSTSHTPG